MPPPFAAVTTDDHVMLDLVRRADEVVVRAAAWAALPEAVVEAANRLRRTVMTATRASGAFDNRVRPALATLGRVLAQHGLEPMVGETRLSGGQVRPDTLVVVLGLVAGGTGGAAMRLDA